MYASGTENVWLENAPSKLGTAPQTTHDELDSQRTQAVAPRALTCTYVPRKTAWTCVAEWTRTEALSFLYAARTKAGHKSG